MGPYNREKREFYHRHTHTDSKIVECWDLKRWSNRKRIRSLTSFMRHSEPAKRERFREKEKSFLLVATAKFILQIIRKKIRADIKREKRNFGCCFCTHTHRHTFKQVFDGP